MAMSPRATVTVRNLANRGDSFARHIMSKALPRDVSLLRNLARRGDKLSQRHLQGTSAPTMARALVNRLARAGEAIAQGLNNMTADKLAQVITFTPPATISETASPLTLTATGGASGLPVTFTLVSGPATLAGAVLTLTGIGDVVVTADQAGNDNYLAATPVQRTITVTA